MKRRHSDDDRFAQLQGQLLQLQRQLAQLQRQSEQQQRQLAQEQRQLAQQQRQLQGQLAQQQGQIGIMGRDIKFLTTQRAITVSNQVLYEFIGEQPRHGQPCNFFSGLSDSKVMQDMLKIAFPHCGCDRQRTVLLRRFDNLADQRNAIAHPALQKANVSWEIRHLLEILNREQADGALDELQQTSLWILSRVDAIRACQSYPFGSTHHQRKVFDVPR